MYMYMNIGHCIYIPVHVHVHWTLYIYTSVHVHWTLYIYTLYMYMYMNM